MVEFKIQSGAKAGTSWVTRRFPVRIGRSASADLQLAEDGVWDQHLQLDFEPATGLILRAHPQAPAAVDGQSFQETVLRNGATIEFGSVKLRFWLSEAPQAGLRVREWLTWAAIAAISLAQIGLIYWLIR